MDFNVPIDLTDELLLGGTNLQSFRFVEKQPESEAFQKWYHANVGPLMDNCILMDYADAHMIDFSFERFGTRYVLTFWCDNADQQRDMFAMINADKLAA